MFMQPSDLREKLITIVIVVGAAIVVVSSIYTYERYYRPSESLFYGAWQGPLEGSGDDDYFEFRSDKTFSGFVVSPRDGEKLPFMKGRWYAGGPYLYLRILDDDTWSHWPLVCRFDIASDHLTICTPHRGYAVWSLRRVPDLHLASNQSLEPTAGRSDD
jgi:hypothetical protein